MKDTCKSMKELLCCIAEDMDKAEAGNKAAAQRVRTCTIKFEKAAKKFRKESVKAEKTGAFAKTKSSAKKKPAKAKKAAKAKKPVKAKKVAKPKKAAKVAVRKAPTKKRATAKLPKRKTARKRR